MDMNYGILALTLLALGRAPAAHAQLFSAPDQVDPPAVGNLIPDAPVENLEGTAKKIRTLCEGKKTILVFYRGGWCPYCRNQLSGLEEVRPDLEKLGYQLLAISPDSIEALTNTRDRLDLKFPLLHDEDFEATQAFGLAYELDGETVKKFNEYDIPLKAIPGSNKFALPVPAVFIINKELKLTYRYYEPDYEIRLSPDTLLERATEVKDD